MLAILKATTVHATQQNHVLRTKLTTVHATQQNHPQRTARKKQNPRRARPDPRVAAQHATQRNHLQSHSQIVYTVKNTHSNEANKKTMKVHMCFADLNDKGEY